MKLKTLLVAVLVGVAATGVAGAGILKRGGVRPPSPAISLSAEDLLAMKPPENERYYMMLFASQSTPKKPRYTHVWATVVKVAEQPDKKFVVEPHTISWMPASLFIKPLRLRVEQGVNLELHFTIQEMYRNGERISMWGPFETWHGFYHRFLTQKQFMDSGAIGYQCVDTIGEAHRTGNGCDCIHAVTDMDPQFGRKQAYALKSNYGEAAGWNIIGKIMNRPVLIKPEIVHDWIPTALDMDKYPIIRRQYSGTMVEYSPEAMREAWRSFSR